MRWGPETRAAAAPPQRQGGGRLGAENCGQWSAALPAFWSWAGRGGWAKAGENQRPSPGAARCGLRGKPSLRAWRTQELEELEEDGAEAGGNWGMPGRGAKGAGTWGAGRGRGAGGSGDPKESGGWGWIRGLSEPKGSWNTPAPPPRNALDQALRPSLKAHTLGSVRTLPVHKATITHLSLPLVCDCFRSCFYFILNGAHRIKTVSLFCTSAETSGLLESRPGLFLQPQCLEQGNLSAFVG